MALLSKEENYKKSAPFQTGALFIHYWQVFTDIKKKRATNIKSIDRYGQTVLVIRPNWSIYQ